MTILLLLALLQDPPDKDKGYATSKEAMQKVQLMIGEWAGTGLPDEDSKLAAWTEKASWNFKIEKDAFSLLFTVADGKLFKDAHLSYDVKKKVFRLELTRADGVKRTYEGKLVEKDKLLTLTEVADRDADLERLEFNLLRDNNFFINIERRRAGTKTWSPYANVRYRKEGVPFVRGEGPKCLITGGAGTIAVSHKGQTYYVC